MATTATKVSEWGNAKQVFEQFGIARGSLYRFADAGWIKSVSIKNKGARKGVRLFNLQSIREMLEKNLV
jgi:predicted site-specific integrase-resolvase